MEYRNATHISMDAAICEINHPEFGWIPFTATPYDPEEHGRDIYGRIVDDIGSPVPEQFPKPSPEELRAALPPITRRQLRLTLVRNGIALDDVAAMIEAMPAGLAKEEARIEWDDASQFERLHPTLVLIGNGLGLTPDQVDALWQQAVDT